MDLALLQGLAPATPLQVIAVWSLIAAPVLGALTCLQLILTQAPAQGAAARAAETQLRRRIGLCMAAQGALLATVLWIHHTDPAHAIPEALWWGVSLLQIGYVLLLPAPIDAVLATHGMRRAAEGVARPS